MADLKLREWERTLRAVLEEMERANGDPEPGKHPPALEQLTRLAWREAHRDLCAKGATTDV